MVFGLTRMNACAIHRCHRAYCAVDLIVDRSDVQTLFVHQVPARKPTCSANIVLEVSYLVRTVRSLMCLWTLAGCVQRSSSFFTWRPGAVTRLPLSSSHRVSDVATRRHRPISEFDLLHFAAHTCLERMLLQLLLYVPDDKIISSKKKSNTYTHTHTHLSRVPDAMRRAFPISVVV